MRARGSDSDQTSAQTSAQTAAEPTPPSAPPSAACDRRCRRPRFQQPARARPQGQRFHRRRRRPSAERFSLSTSSILKSPRSRFPPTRLTCPPITSSTFRQLRSADRSTSFSTTWSNIEIEDQLDARRQVMKFIKRHARRTRFAIFVRSDGLYLVQGFTADKDLLYADSRPANPKPHVPRVFMMGKNLGYGDPPP